MDTWICVWWVVLWITLVQGTPVHRADDKDNHAEGLNSISLDLNHETSGKSVHLNIKQIQRILNEKLSWTKNQNQNGDKYDHDVQDRNLKTLQNRKKWMPPLQEKWVNPQKKEKSKNKQVFSADVNNEIEDNWTPPQKQQVEVGLRRKWIPPLGQKERKWIPPMKRVVPFKKNILQATHNQLKRNNKETKVDYKKWIPPMKSRAVEENQIDGNIKNEWMPQMESRTTEEASIQTKWMPPLVQAQSEVIAKQNKQRNIGQSVLGLKKWMPPMQSRKSNDNSVELDEIETKWMPPMQSKESNDNSIQHDEIETKWMPPMEKSKPLTEEVSSEHKGTYLSTDEKKWMPPQEDKLEQTLSDEEIESKWIPPMRRIVLQDKQETTVSNDNDIQSKWIPPMKRKLPLLNDIKKHTNARKWVPPVEKWMPPVEKWMPPVEKWMPPVEKWMPPVEKWMPPVEKWMPPVESKANKENMNNDERQAKWMPPVEKWIYPPIRNNVNSVKDDKRQTKWMSPVEKWMPPVEKWMPPVEKWMPPVEKWMPPVEKWMPPVEKWIDPPIKNNINSVKDDKRQTKWMPLMESKHIAEKHEALESSDVSGLLKRLLPYIENNVRGLVLVEGVEEEESFEEDCERLFVAYQNLLESISGLGMDIMDINVMDTDDYDLNDPVQLHQLCCVIVTFGRKHMVDDLPEEERQLFEESMLLFKLTVGMMKMFMPGPNEPVPSGMEAEMEAVNALVEFYCVLEQVEFIPELSPQPGEHPICTASTS